MLTPESANANVFVLFPNSHGKVRRSGSPIFFSIPSIIIVENCSLRTTLDVFSSYWQVWRRSWRNFAYSGISANASTKGLLIGMLLTWFIKFLCSCSNGCTLGREGKGNVGWYGLTKDEVFFIRMTPRCEMLFLTSWKLGTSTIFFLRSLFSLASTRAALCLHLLPLKTQRWCLLQ